MLPKRLELLRELVPGTVRVAVLANPPSYATTEAVLRGVEAGARTLGFLIQVLHASTSREMDRHKMAAIPAISAIDQRARKHPREISALGPSRISTTPQLKRE
jgi:hypothetical protein